MSEQHECPECGKSFDSERGLHIHIGEVHKEKKEELLNKREEEKEESGEEAQEKGSEEDEQEGKGFIAKLKDNIMPVGAAAVLIALAVFVALNGVPQGINMPGDGTVYDGTGISPDKASQRAVSYLESMPQLQRASVSVVNTTKSESGFYKIHMNISSRGRSQTVPAYETLDGALLFTGATETNRTVDEMSNSTAKEISKDAILSIVERNPMVSKENFTVTFNKVEEKVSGVYPVTLSLTSPQGTQEVNAYLSKDGSYFFPQGINLTEENKKEVEFSAPSSSRPNVTLYVQSFCPYGNEAENKLEGVYEALKGEVNWEHRFIVSESDGEFSSLHGEEEVVQSKRERCVIENEGLSTWFDFATYVNENCGESGSCWEEAAESANLTASSIKTCVNDSGNELLSVDAQAVGEEGVSASPTLMINGEKKPTFRSKDLVIGEQSFSPDEQRSPEAYKAAICSAFEEKPDACNMNLSTEAGSSSGTC